MTIIIWDDEKVSRLRKMYAQGNSLSQIAEEFGCSKSAVSGKISRLEMADRGSSNDAWIRANRKNCRPRFETHGHIVKELHQRGFGDLKIGRHIGIHKATVAQWRGRLGLPAHKDGCVPYTEDEDLIITEMTAAGRPNHEIAARIGRTEMAISSRKTNLGLSRPSLKPVPEPAAKYEDDLPEGTYRNERGVTLPLISCLAKSALVYAEGM